jgi:hypothetical protein
MKLSNFVLCLLVPIIPDMVKVKVKVKLPLCLTKCYAMKTFLTSALDEDEYYTRYGDL